MTVWQGSKERWQYIEINASDISTTDVANALMVSSLNRDAFVFSFVNNTSGEIQIMLVNPEDATQTKKVFTGLTSGFGFSSETINAGGVFIIPAQTKIYIHALGQALSSGKVRLFIWG